MRKQWWIDLSEVLNALRVMPRVLVGVYGLYGIYIVEWYMKLPVAERTMEASGFAAIVLSAFAKLCHWYMGTNGDNDDK
jgi:hypothetical protein